jgi:GWxTD domain-containing protein
MALIVAPILVGGLAALASEKLDRDAQRWLDRVRLFLVPGEEEAFRELRDAGDRREFQRIFWARRDPTPKTSENELEDAATRAWKVANDRFSLAGSAGSETGCGQVLAFLGEPMETERRELSARFDNAQAMREGSRSAETWIYKSRSGDPFPFTGGELRLSLDEACRLTEGGREADELRRIAAARITRPSLDYRRTADGHLVPLDDQRGAPTNGPLVSGKTDFPLAVEPKLMLRAGPGSTYLAGLIRIGANGASRAGAPASIRVGAQTVDPGQAPGPMKERKMQARKDEGGGLLASFGLPLEPGRHTVRVAVTLPDGWASEATFAVDAPDFDAAPFGASPLIVYPDLEGAPPPAADGPFAAFAFGALRVEPRFGNVFSAKESLQVTAVLHGGSIDPATGKASLRAVFKILKDGKPVAKSTYQEFDTASAVASIGPVPLSGFGAGRYVVQLLATDARIGKTEGREAEFEVKE